MQTATMDDHGATDRDVERLVHEIGGVIEKARPEEREELCQMASDLIQEEMVRAQLQHGQSDAEAKHPLNLVGLGAFVLILGAGISILVPSIGLILLGGGLAALILGAIYRMVSD